MSDTPVQLCDLCDLCDCNKAGKRTRRTRRINSECDLQYLKQFKYKLECACQATSYSDEFISGCDSLKCLQKRYDHSGRYVVELYERSTDTESWIHVGAYLGERLTYEKPACVIIE